MNDTNWIEELSNLAVGGLYIPSAEGLIIVFRVPDLSTKPELVDKKYEGNTYQKFQWKVILEDVKWHKDAYKEIIADKKGGDKKLEQIDNMEIGKEYIFELSKTATKQLSKFLLDEKITSEDQIKYLRLGTSNETEYKFKKV